MREDFRNHQRFLWKEDLELDEEVLEGVIVTLMYSISAQSQNAMVKIAKEIQEKTPALAEVMLKGHYVDDLADSKATKQEVLAICQGW